MASSRTVSLQASNGQYVCAEGGGGGIVVANRSKIGIWETFTVHDLGNRQIALQAYDGHFVCAEEGGGGAVHANRNAIGPWETFRIHDLGEANIALETWDGRHFICAEGGGGGPVVANRVAIGPWETFRAIPPLTAGERRTGVVSARGRAFGDETGLFHPLGSSFFWALWGLKFDPDRTEQNLAFLAERGVQYVRIFGEVGGQSWEDRTIDPAWRDYADVLARWIDLAFDSYGIRTELTVFAGGASRDHSGLIDTVIRVSRGRELKFLDFEGANEAYANFPNTAELRTHVRRLHQQTPILCGVSSPGDGDQVAIINSYNADDVANLAIIHSDRRRDTVEGSWRQVRQTWDFRDLRWPGTNNEPPGPQSSVATAEDPLQIAMTRAVGILCGVGAYVLHTGAGVRGGGAADRARGRSANFWEVPGIDDILSALRNVVTPLPDDLENWQKHNGHWPTHPLPADAIWTDGADHGVMRTYGATRGGQFVTMPLAVKRYVVLTPRQECTLRIVNPATAEDVETVHLSAGEGHRLAGPEEGGLGAYIVLGET